MGVGRARHLLHGSTRARGCRAQEDDVIKVERGEITRLKEIPVPQSVASELTYLKTDFERPREYLKTPTPAGAAAGSSYSSVPYTYGARAPAAPSPRPPARRPRAAWASA